MQNTDLGAVAAHLSSHEAQPGTQSLSASQQSSVEEWLEQTAQARPRSPELGTPGIDRSAEHSPESSGLRRRLLTNKRVAHPVQAIDPPLKRPKLDSSPPASSAVPVGDKAREGSSAQSRQSGPFVAPHLPARLTPKRQSLPASFGISKGVAPTSTAPPTVNRDRALNGFASAHGTPSTKPRQDSALKGFPTSTQPTGLALDPVMKGFDTRPGAMNASSRAFLKPAPRQRTASNPYAKGKEPEIPSSSAKTVPAAATKPSSSAASKPSSLAQTSGRRSLEGDWWKKENTPFQKFASGWMSSGK